MSISGEPACSFRNGPYPRAFVHRGWHRDDLDGMENSLSAFRRAVTEGFRYLETDVHATTDGVAVVHHDDVLDRTTDGSGTIAQLPWERVRRARIGGVEPLCRLEELLEELPDALFNVDVKADSAVAPVLRALRRTGAWQRVCLATFSERRLARLRRIGTRMAGPGLVTSMGPTSIVALWFAARGFPVARAVRGQHAQVPVSSGRLHIVDERMIRWSHAAGHEVHVWTIDEESEMRRLLDVGVDGLFTDRPDLLRNVLRKSGLWPQRV